MASDITPAIYRYFLVDLLSNTLLAEIPFEGVSFERALSAAGSFEGSIPVFESTSKFDLYKNTMPGSTALYVVRNGICVWGGIVWSRNYDIISRTLSVNASEFPSYLQHRVVWADFIYSKNPQSVVSGGGTRVDITLPSTNSYPTVANTSVYISFFPTTLMALSGFYNVLSSPAPTSTTFSVTIPGFPNPAVISQVVTDSEGVATATTTAAHEFKPGLDVTISGINTANRTYLNGTYKILEVPTSTTFTYYPAKKVSTKFVSFNAVTLTSAGHGIPTGSTILVENVDTKLDGVPKSAVTFNTNTISYTAYTGGPETTFSIDPAVATPTGTVVKTDAVTVTGLSSTARATLKLNTSDVEVMFRTDTYDYVRQLLTEAFSDFTINSGTNTGVIPEISAGTTQNTAEVTNIVLTDEIATLTMSASTPAKEIVPGQRITVSNFASPYTVFNGTFFVTSVDTAARKISYKIPGASNVSSTAVSSLTSSVVYRQLSKGIATLTTSTPHGLVVGSKVKVSNVDSPWFMVDVFDTPTITNIFGVPIEQQVTVTEVPSSTTFKYETARKPARNGGGFWFLEEPGGVRSVLRKKSVAGSPNGVSKITTTEDHKFAGGDVVRISGVDKANVPIFNGEWTILNNPPSPTSFRFTNTKFAGNVADTKSAGKVTLVKKAVSGTVTYKPTVVSKTYGPFYGNSSLDITIPNTLSGIRFRNSPIVATDLKTVYEHLDEYVTKSSGFDYRIDCSYDEATNSFKRDFVFVPVEFPNPPAAGQPSPVSRFGADELVFEYPGNISNFSMDESAEDTATRFFVVSSESGTNARPPFVAAAADDLLKSGWPLLDQVEKQTWPIVDQQANRDRYAGLSFNDDVLKTAQRYLKESRPPVTSMTVEVNGSLSPEIGTYYPGDWCSLVVNDDFVQLRLQSDLEPRDTVLVRKIVAIKVSVPDVPTFPETATLTLLPDWEVDVIGQ